jgi:glutamyl-tRNA synthetase
MKPTGKGKLSKRDGEKMGFPVFPLQWETSKGYRETGYFPEAVLNFLALLGWNPGTEQEFFSLEELIKAFSLERVHKAGARFDPEKTKWYNQHYLQQKTNEELAQIYAPLLADKLAGVTQNRSGFDLNLPDSEATLTRIVSLIKERATFVSDFWNLSRYFFIAPETYDSAALSKHWKSSTPALMGAYSSLLNELDDFKAVPLETVTKQWIADNGYSFGQIMPPLRLIIVGALQGPHLFDILEIIGKNETLTRIQKALVDI